MSGGPPGVAEAARAWLESYRRNAGLAAEDEARSRLAAAVRGWAGPWTLSWVPEAQARALAKCQQELADARAEVERVRNHRGWGNSRLSRYRAHEAAEEARRKLMAAKKELAAEMLRYAGADSSEADFAMLERSALAAAGCLP